MIDVGRLDRELRNKGISNKQAAGILDLSTQGFLNKLNGKREFRANELRILSHVIGIKAVEEIFLEEPEKRFSR